MGDVAVVEVEDRRPVLTEWRGVAIDPSWIVPLPALTPEASRDCYRILGYTVD